MDSKTLQRIKPLLISAPSGCGKGTLINRLVSDYGHIFKPNVSYTTRAPREGEVHGVHRFFVSMEEFTKAIEDGKFIEFAMYADNYYGTHRDYINSIIADNKICIIEVEVQGAKSISKTDLDCNFLFIKPPSFEALRERLIHRGTETPSRVVKRMDSAEWELEEAEKSDIFPAKLVNDDFETFYAEVRQYLRSKYPGFEF